jgi:hypothetical protein
VEPRVKSGKFHKREVNRELSVSERSSSWCHSGNHLSWAFEDGEKDLEIRR